MRWPARPARGRRASASASGCERLRCRASPARREKKIRFMQSAPVAYLEACNDVDRRRSALRTGRHGTLNARATPVTFAWCRQPRCHSFLAVDRWLCVPAFRRVCPDSTRSTMPNKPPRDKNKTPCTAPGGSARQVICCSASATGSTLAAIQPACRRPRIAAPAPAGTAARGPADPRQPARSQNPGTGGFRRLGGVGRPPEADARRAAAGPGAAGRGRRPRSP